MTIRKPYKELPIGFSNGVTMTEIGPIYDVYFVMSDGTHKSIGRIGNNQSLPGSPLYYATPIMYSPFTNTARRFRTRKDAAIYLLGVYESTTAGMQALRKHPVPGNIAMRQMF